MKRLGLIILAVIVLGMTAPAYAAAAPISSNPLIDGILSTFIYGAIGIFMAFVAYKVIDLLTPGNLGKDIANNNIALALLAGLQMLGICIIIAAVLAS